MTLVLTITNFFGSASLLFNLCLLIIIFLRPPAHNESFKKNYYAINIVNTLLALAQLIAAPCFFSDGDVYLIYSSRHLGTFPIVFFVLIYNTSFVAISHNFFVRYMNVCKLEMDFETDFIFGSTLKTLSGTGMFLHIRRHMSSRKLRSINYRLLIILKTQVRIYQL
ncbi:hypothetical protein PMAYCL1PPCAC_05790, partial [Pristionchus mayeri]